MPEERFSIIVLSFLKTTEPVDIGRLTFRPTEDVKELSSEQATCVVEIADMLFLQDSLRIKSASYSIAPYIDLDHYTPTPTVEHLINIQAVIAYCYASPRHEFGDLFLSSEHASMAVFTPGRMFVSLVRPDFNVEDKDSAPDLEVDDRGEIAGYSGLYNFRYPFWVTKGSRLYGPLPKPTLNRNQNISHDLNRAKKSRTDYQLLKELLRKQNSARLHV